ncbi:MarR family transcriptional regulator [Knoellia locipacati]|uniref:helix-turn-helix transcriptional regulator n=1 Tax=Knoellia locipacati TaxID=882824 RepID=UPI003850F258
MNISHAAASLADRMAAGFGPPPATRSRVHEAPGRASWTVLERLEEQDAPITVAALTEATGQHPNTVREHLDTLVAAGLVARTRAETSGRGRPAWLYAAVPAPETGSPEYAALATALARQLARTSDRPRDDAAAAGRDWGGQLATGVTPRPRTPAAARRGVVSLLKSLGFAPTTNARATAVRLRQCPLLEAAIEEPEVVCAVHLGIVRGALEEWRADPAGTTLVPFAEPGACLLHLGGARPRES